MKIVEKVKNVGNAIRKGWDRLGQPDISDDEELLIGNDTTTRTLRESLNNIDAYAKEVYSNSSSSANAGKNGGKGKTSNIVDRVDTNPLEAIRNVEQAEQSISRGESSRERVE